MSEENNPTRTDNGQPPSSFRWVVEFSPATQGVKVEGAPVNLDFLIAVLGMAQEAVRDMKRNLVAQNLPRIMPATSLPLAGGRKSN